VHRVRVPSEVDKLRVVRRSVGYFLHADHEVPINVPLVYNDESLNETAEEKEKRGGEILTAKQFSDNCLLTMLSYA